MKSVEWEAEKKEKRNFYLRILRKPLVSIQVLGIMRAAEVLFLFLKVTYVRQHLRNRWGGVRCFL